MNLATSRNGRLAAQGYYPKVAIDSSGNITVLNGRSWVVELLPHLGRQDLFDSWNLNSAWDNGVVPGPDGSSTNREIAATYLQVLICPHDETVFQQPGGLSYVVNCGIGDRNFTAFSRGDFSDRSDLGHAFQIEPFDWDGDGILPPNDPDDIAITREMGVFWPEFGFFSASSDDTTETGDISGSANFQDIHDGASNTILLTENVNAGMAPGSTFNSWANPQLSNCGFLWPVKPAAVNPAIAGTGLQTIVDESAGDPRINAMNDGQHDGQAPFPNSMHSGIVVVSWCSGSVTTLSEDIDPSVYVRLLTPGGIRPRDIPGFMPEAPVSETDF
ncbi:MAG: DUF1559 domain-containing protein [Planctomycetaceae bacterium]